MCGIVGYIGPGDVPSILIKGLKHLEYRGYDSAGMCIVSQDGLHLVRKKGRIHELENDPVCPDMSGFGGIAHTRWATHGEPNEINAHPHTCCRNEIAIVHNGIIENYHALKKVLEGEGHIFVSETDSETAAHLIEKFLPQGGSLEDAVLLALECIEGTFGLAVIKKGEKKIVAARRGSPLIIGVCDGCMVLASDTAALMEHTKEVIYLNDNELAVLTKQDCSIRTVQGEEVEKNIQRIRSTVHEIEKKGYKHFMLKEIFEQPDSLANTLRGRIGPEGIKLTLDTDFSSIQRIILTACGTSWHAALIGKYLIERIGKIPVEVDYASEFRYRDSVFGDTDLLAVISQSGETADTLAAIEKGKSAGIRTLGIVNTVGSTIAREVDAGIYLHAGPEIGVASTKAFTCQVTALVLLSLLICREKGFSPDRKLAQETEKVPGKIQEVLDDADAVQEIAARYKEDANVLYLGRGLNFPVALEGALKLKEISYIHAEGYPAAEMKHGPIALIDENMPVVFIASHGPTFEKIFSNIQEVKARKGRIITITDSCEKGIEDISDHVIRVPAMPEELQPIVNVIPLQLFAYYIADMKGLDVDKPRNLAKSVTVE